MNRLQRLAQNLVFLFGLGAGYASGGPLDESPQTDDVTVPESAAPAGTPAPG